MHNNNHIFMNYNTDDNSVDNIDITLHHYARSSACVCKSPHTMLDHATLACFHLQQVLVLVCRKHVCATQKLARALHQLCLCLSHVYTHVRPGFIF